MIELQSDVLNKAQLSVFNICYAFKNVVQVLCSDFLVSLIANVLL